MITQVFKRHGASTIDTPVFELKDVLTSKYGEDSKLIYDLADQGGEICALRYDLTVPFARYLAMNTHIKQFKRFQIGKVYRRDQPQMTHGRYREFYQCDCDIAGVYDSMMPDAEILCMMYEVLSELQIGEFIIGINHRKILDGILEVCGVPEDKLRTICSTIDKTDKMPWSEVKTEMVEEKGLDVSVADKIESYLQNRDESSSELLQRLLHDPLLADNKRVGEGLNEIALLFEYLNAYSIGASVALDLSLARGLDYYTGVIYEAFLVGRTVGSIAGGGRYDNLVGMFNSKQRTVPCVGLSIGIERIFAILETNVGYLNNLSFLVQEVDVLVCSVGSDLTTQRMSLVSELWRNGIRAEIIHKQRPRFLDQITYCEEHQIPLAVIIGEDEVKKGVVKLKNVRDRDDKGTEIPRDSIVEAIIELSGRPFHVCELKPKT